MCGKVRGSLTTKDEYQIDLVGNYFNSWVYCDKVGYYITGIGVTRYNNN